MGTTNLNIRTDREIKKAAEEIFESLGLNMSTAINIFLRSVVREKGFPFDIKLNVPNEETKATRVMHSDITDETARILEEDYGYIISKYEGRKLFFGGVQGIVFDSQGKMHGGADIRRDGKALGW